MAESSGKLEPLKHMPDFDHFKDLLKKEIDKTQKKFKLTKRSKFKRHLDNWARGEIFDLTPRGSRSWAPRRRFPSRPDTSAGMQFSGSEDESHRSVTFLENDLLELEGPPQSRGIQKGGKAGTTEGGKGRGKYKETAPLPGAKSIHVK